MIKKIDNIYTTTQEKLQYRKNLDKLKSDLLKEHGINLITIHFKDVISEEYVKKIFSFLATWTIASRNARGICTW